MSYQVKNLEEFSVTKDNKLDVFSEVIPDHIDPDTEIKECRTLTSKAFALDNERALLVCRNFPVHYKSNVFNNDEEWKEIDLTPVENEDSWEVHNSFYDFKLEKNTIKYSYLSKKRGRIDAELYKIGDEVIRGKTLKPKFEGGWFIYEEVVPNVDIKIKAKPAGIAVYKVIKVEQPQSNRFEWKINQDKNASFSVQEDTLGIDAEGEYIQIKHDKSEPIDKGEFESFTFTETFTGKVSRVVDPTTRKKEWFDDPKYPVIIDADVIENIVDNNDDGSELVNTTYTVNTPIGPGAPGTFDVNNILVGFKWLLTTTNNIYHGGFRFQSVPVDQGADIFNATLNVRVTAKTGSPESTVFGDDVDSAATWATSKPSEVTKTTASTTFDNPAAATNHQIDVTAIVQEIVNRGGWATNNNMRFACLNDRNPPGTSTTSTHRMTLYDYSSGTTNDARLEITLSATDLKTGGVNLGHGLFI